MEKQYIVQFNLVDEEYEEDEEFEQGDQIVPVSTIVYIQGAYWLLFTKEEQDEELKEMATTQLEAVGIHINPNIVDEISIIEVAEKQIPNSIDN